MTRYRIPAPSIAEPITATPPKKSSHWLRLVGLRTTNTPNTRHRVGVPNMPCLPEAARGLGDGHHVLQLLIDFWLCSLFVLMDKIYTLRLERLHGECKDLWGTSSTLYHPIDGLLRDLANPDLRDIPMRLPFRVELWD